MVRIINTAYKKDVLLHHKKEKKLSYVIFIYQGPRSISHFVLLGQIFKLEKL